MSQPLNQREHHPALGDLDEDQGEFWMANPWEAVSKNLSAYERNRVLLNRDGQRFLDISFPTGADLDSDSRSAIATDLTADGMPDLIIRGTGGGPLRFFQNHFPPRSWLKISLRGVESNSYGIGARLKVETHDRTLHRQLYPQSAFQSQTPALIEVGLGDATTVRRLTVEWPSGQTDELQEIPVSQHIQIFDGSGQWNKFKPSSRTNTRPSNRGATDE